MLLEKPLDYEEIRSLYSVSFCDNDLVLQLLPLTIATGKLSNHNMDGTVETKKKAYLPIPEYWCTVNRRLNLRDNIIKCFNSVDYSLYLLIRGFNY